MFVYLTILLVLFLLMTYASFKGTRYALKMLREKQILDHPNQRSNHTLPTPRGGGIAILAVMAGGFFMITWARGEIIGAVPLFISMVILGAVSFADDLTGLPVKMRMVVQMVAVFLGLLLLPIHILVPEYVWLPHWLLYIVIALSWLWFINLYNFMDGIDGITGVETISIALGVALIAFVTGHVPLAAYAVIVAGATLGFLFLNWHPAAIFMGDVGSVVLGFVTGWLLLQLALYGHIVAALILPGYYLADSGITLLKRLIAKENIFEAHSKHYYQQAVKAGRSHAEVSIMIAKLNLVLMALALISALYPMMGWVCAPLAIAAIVAVLRLFGGKRA